MRETIPCPLLNVVCVSKANEVNYRKGVTMKPDWKKADDYSFPANTSLNRWAAEFLWRNDDFLKELKAAHEEPQSQTPLLVWSNTPKGKVLKKWGASPMLPKWVEKRLCDSYLVFENYPRYVPSYKVETAGGLFTANGVGQYFRVAPELPDKTVFEFDLSSPINPQIARAKAMLAAQQKQNSKGKVVVKKAMVKLYPGYLRILDALTAGATKNEIAEVFSKENSGGDFGIDKLDKQIAVAKRLMESGYRTLNSAPAASGVK